MRLHLPKALLAAVLAACLAWPAGATEVTVEQQSDLTTDYEKSSAVSGLTSSDDLLVFDTSAGLYLPRYASADDKTVGMPMSIRIDQNLTIDKGFSSTTYNFSGSISCAETVTATMKPDVTGQVYNFSGSLANFKGTLSLNSNITANFNNVGTVGAKSISLAGPTTIAGTFSTSGNLTNTGTLTNRGSLTIGGSYTGGTITQDSSASLVLSNGSIVNLDSIAATNNLTNTETTGVQAYSKSWALVSGGSLTDNGATYKVGGNALTDGSMSLGTFTSATSYNYYNVASGTSKSYSEVSAEIGTNFVGFINVLGTLEGFSATNEATAKAMTSIVGTGKVLVSGTLEYGQPEYGQISFLNEFEGTLEIGNGGFLKLGYTSTQLGNLSALKVTEGGKIGGWNINQNGKKETKPSGVTLELAGGTLTTAGGNLVYSGAIQVTENSYFDISNNNISITGALKINENKSISVNSGSNTKLNHDGFAYVGTTITALTSDEVLSLYNNATVTNGTLTQTANAGGGVNYKEIGATLTNVKLVNSSGLETRLTANDSLSAIDIKGKLVVKSDTSVSGVATVSGTLEVDSGKSLKLTGQDTTSSITTLTGSGTLKTTGGTTTVTNASGFSGTLEATGGTLTANGTTTTDSNTVTLGSLSGLKATGGSIVLENVAATLALTDLVVAGNGSISGATSYATDKVSIGAGAAGSLVGNLSIKDNGTITLDASAGTTGTGLALGTSTTGSLTLGSGVTLNLINLGVLKEGESLTLFTGVTEFIYSSATSVAALSDDDVSTNTVSVDASEIFGNVDPGFFTLNYDGSNVILTASTNVPEPTTATLSLLALMGLAARRRRRKA